MEFVSLVSAAAADEDEWQAVRSRLGGIAAASRTDRQAFEAKRALVQEWIEKGAWRSAPCWASAGRQ